jgi:hypothetical protein
VCEICANNSDGGPDGHQELFEWLTQEADPLSNIITGDKSWVFASEPEMRYQSCECHTKMSCQKRAAGYKISGGHADHIFNNLDDMSLSLNDKQLISLFMHKFWSMWQM